MQTCVPSATDQSVTLYILDDTAFTPETGVTAASGGLDLWYQKGATGAKVSITEVDLTNLTDAHSDGGLKHKSNGQYRLDLPDAAVPTSENEVTTIGGAVTGMIVCPAFLVGKVTPSTITTAQVNTEADTALADVGLTSTVTNRIDAAVTSRSSHTAADVWTSATRTLTAFAFSVTVGTNNDKSGYSLSAAGVQAIWDALTSALTTAGSIGKLLVDNVNATISSRLATSGYTAPDNATITTIADRLGAFTGTGVNTVLGFLRAMSNKAAGIATPSDLTSGGGGFINTTDSLENIKDTAGGSLAGAGAVAHVVTVTVSGVPIDNVGVWITSDSGGVDTGTVVAGTLYTNASGQATFNLDATTWYWQHGEKAGYNFSATRFQTAAS